MPRKSSSAIATLPAIDVRQSRLQPRDEAPAEVKDVFRELVRSQPPQHFRAGDGDLLELYAQSIVLARGAFAEIELTGGLLRTARRARGLPFWKKTTGPRRLWRRVCDYAPNPAFPRAPLSGKNRRQ